MIHAVSSSPVRVDRSLLVDGLKALAAQMVVIHHLVSYGPMAEAAGLAAPGLAAWFGTYGRWAVQVFLVVAGFLTAQAFCGRPAVLSRPWSLVAKRYVRLVWPFGVAVTLAVIVAQAARYWTQDPIVPGEPSFMQYAAHWFLIQGLLGHDSLSTGVWYVAIDFQLFVLTILLLWASRALRWSGWAPLLIGVLTAASLIWIRTWQDWDNWAPYFYNAYGVGMLIGWLGLRDHAHQWVRIALALVLGVLLWQWAMSLNGRLLIILATGALLWIAGFPATQRMGSWRNLRNRIGVCVHYLGATSYALFLMHFPVSMLVNAAQDRFDWTTPRDGLLAMGVAWVLSMLVAALFYRYVERQALLLSRRVR